MSKGKPIIPDNLKEIWNKDYYELIGTQRTALTEFYIDHLQKVQQGAIKKKLDPPFFMTQQEVLEKEEDIKLDVARAVEKEQRDQEEVALDAAKKESDRSIWESRKFLKMDEVERLMVENYQLKLELAEKTIKEFTYKKKEIEEAQASYAQYLESKYKILLDDYAIDLNSGAMMRYGHAPYREPTEKK